MLSNGMMYTERYTIIVNGLNYENVKKCIPFSCDDIKSSLRVDRNLSNLSIEKWDKAAECRVMAKWQICFRE